MHGESIGRQAGAHFFANSCPGYMLSSSDASRLSGCLPENPKTCNICHRNGVLSTTRATQVLSRRRALPQRRKTIPLSFTSQMHTTSQSRVCATTSAWSSNIFHAYLNSRRKPVSPQMKVSSFSPASKNPFGSEGWRLAGLHGDAFPKGDAVSAIFKPNPNRVYDLSYDLQSMPA